MYTYIHIYMYIYIYLCTGGDISRQSAASLRNDAVLLKSLSSSDPHTCIFLLALAVCNTVTTLASPSASIDSGILL